MKKQIIIVSVVACALIVVLAGCTSSGSSSASSASSSTSSSSASASAASESASAASESASSASAGMPNPWQTVASAEEAAKGAGLDGFTVIDGLTISYGKIDPWTYQFMKGIAEADSNAGTVKLIVRKGTKTEDGDISGDYNTYAHNWTQNIKGLEVTCFGNTEGKAAKTIWTVGDTSYCILAHGQGSEITTVGLTADELNSFINGIQ